MLHAHRKYAFRLGLRRKVALATALLLICLPLALAQGGIFLLLSLLGFLYPSRWERNRALSAIDQRGGLAYRSWLEASAEHPYRQSITQAAQQQTRALALPKWPGRELLLYIALLAGLYLWIWLSPPQIGFTATGSSASQPQETAAGAPAPQEAVPEPAPIPSETPAAGSPAESPAAGAEPTPSEPAGSEGGQGSNRDPGTATPSSGPQDQSGAEAGPVDSSQTGEQTAGAGDVKGNPESVADSGQEKAETSTGSGPTETTTGNQSAESNQSAGNQPGSSNAPGGASNSGQTGGQNVGQGQNSDGVEAHELTPEGPASSLERTPGQGNTGAGELIANPWRGGAPPQEIQRAAESYLQNEPLEAGARKAVQRYFELGAE